MSNELAACERTMPVALALGTVIGRKYRIDQVIAEGGMGIVYKGWHLVLQHPIAIKVVRPEFAHHPEAASRFVNEARASAQLHSIHAAHVLDLGRIDHGPPVMVLEYLEGCDLRNLLATEGALSLSRAVDYVLQVCEAMAEAHAQGIVHRDLKPENLFLCRMPDGTEILKVIDFGISKRLEPKSRSYTRSQSFGSPDYMAPEQMSAPDRVDARADLWSIGIVLFELLTNRVPFHGNTVHATCATVMCDEPVPLRSLRPDVPVSIEQIVLRCLKKDAEHRYPSVRELAQELAPFASPEWSQADSRVRRILGEAGDASESPSSSMRVLSVHEPYDPPQSGPGRGSEDAELRVPMKPIWPHLLSVAAVLGLVALLAAPRGVERVLSGTTELTVNSVAIGTQKACAAISAASRLVQSDRPVTNSFRLFSSPTSATALSHVRASSVMSAAHNAPPMVRKPELASSADDTLGPAVLGPGSVARRSIPRHSTGRGALSEEACFWHPPQVMADDAELD